MREPIKTGILRRRREYIYPKAMTPVTDSLRSLNIQMFLRIRDLLRNSLGTEIFFEKGE